eukprot:CAMPEP_0182524452 /NCGR_PEP_ID=MMETSP1323-20130603/1793_1 /TAXON_ID=236787 /ORGANISM="Florenciella parvula, Strain RCC1693" /LENGTH=48 /DNA_ID= /DNA_START= /DNA_END= /DNA_ORIENTATION=
MSKAADFCALVSSGGAGGECSMAWMMRGHRRGLCMLLRRARAATLDMR